ncbi:putative PEP-binding protein, partial [Microbacterium sp. UBA6633]|uniref:putative PEP-binding protein n=1 Tax=Microbacterium sp. UBA6633 TaxID=1946951 RepID=UPI0032E3A1D3
AADRLLGSVASFQDPWHPAVLRLVREVGTAGARLGKPVGICGEAAADPLLAVVLVGLGATSLSMAQ